MAPGPVYFERDDHSDAALLWSLRGPQSEWRVGRYAVGAGEGTPPKIALLLIGDGRDGIRAATIASFLQMVYGYELGAVVQVDDRHHTLGFGGAIQAGWHHLSMRLREAALAGQELPFDYVFHLEEDWCFLDTIDVRWLAGILTQGEIAQAALLRGPVNDQERAAGGLVEAWPKEYAEGGAITSEGAVPFLQHRLFFTTNPSLYRTSLMLLGWPGGPASEQHFTRALVGMGYSFAFYGTRQAGPSIEHTGHVRTGHGY